MIVRDETLPPRVELSGSQRALLEERLQRARQFNGAKAAEPRAAIPRRPGDAVLPLSFAQERLWFLDQLEPGSAVYNMTQAIRMRGPLEVGALENALNEIVRRHEILRTNFVADEGEGRAIQVISPARTLPLPLVDLDATRTVPIEEELRRRLCDEARKPFDFARDLLVRALLVRVSPTDHTLMLTMHHIISDGWSIGVLFRELAALYGSFCRGETPALPELPLQFADFVLWERESLQGAALEKPLAYWKKQLGGTLPVLELPADRARAAGPTSRGAAQSIQLSRGLTQALRSFGQQEGATLFMTLLAAFQVLLHRWTGQEDIVVGSVVAGRRKVELEKLIGFFVNTLVFRGDLAGNPSFRELLARVRETALGALAHQDLPFERIVQELRPDRNASRNPLFQVMFVLQNAPMAPSDMPCLEVETLEVDSGTAKFDLTLSMLEAPQGLRAALEYNADLFEPATIARLLGSFQTLLEGIVTQPDQKISRLPLLTPEERQQVVGEWNQTATAYPREQTIPQLFAEQVAAAPAAPAVTFGDTTLSYAELDAQAEALAARLRELGVQPDTLVGVCLERSLELIVSLVAIVKAGGVYVSLDPAYPRERLLFMLEDTRAPVLLTQTRLRDRLPAQGAEIVCVDEPAAPASGPASARGSSDASAPLTPEHLAYVSYTSGSTGKPKGVGVPHRGVVRLVKNTNYAHFGADEVFLQFAPIAFDASTLEIWGALLNGARLVVCPPGPLSLAELGECIEQAGVTTLWLTAGLFHQMVEEQLGRLRNVRQLLAGGDVLSPTHVARALEALPGTHLINGYGPTENTTFTCCHRISAAPAPGRSVPIGRPIANTQVYILDRDMQPVPPGVPGELYTGGDGLARGYLNRPELTAEKFVPSPFALAASAAGAGGDEGPTAPAPRLYRTGDLARWLPDGTIEFLGRVDRQAKIRGFRVEPQEIENVLAQHPAVKECAVVVRDDATGAKCLVAYVVLKSSPAPTTAAWRDFLAAKVPEYLIPSAFVALEVLPLNANGKVNLAALPAVERRAEPQHARVAPRDDVEKRLVEIWEKVLGVQPIGIHDRFFDLGGHSLLAVRMIAQLEKSFGRRLPVAAIFQHRNIEQLARLLRTDEPRYTPATSLVEIQGKGTRAPLYLVHGVGGGMFWGYSNLARHLGNDQPVFAFKSRGLEGQPEWPTIEDMAKSYVADLRAHQPHGPYLLGGYCFGGVVAYEMARQLQAQGEEVSLLAMFNSSPPNTGYDRVPAPRTLRWRLLFARNLFYWFGCFVFRWTWRERSEFVRWKLKILRKKTIGPLGANSREITMTDVDELVNLADYSDRQRAVWQAHVRALMKYHPQPVENGVTLFRTRGHSLLCSFDEHYGWGELARRGVAMRIMPGGHGNILDEPYVATVAAALRECLAAAAKKNGGVA